MIDTILKLLETHVSITAGELTWAQLHVHGFCHCTTYNEKEYATTLSNLRESGYFVLWFGDDIYYPTDKMKKLMVACGYTPLDLLAEPAQ